jgi:hypothetical protein
MVESRVYLIFPPEAAEWARQTGLATPPDSYDVIPEALSASSSAGITSPSMFTYVRGKVPILGSAGGEGFLLYRLQTGKGLNPKDWFQIGSDRSEPVEAGELGLWETQGLSGLYAIQLLVVSEDTRIDSAVIQVTVDNQAPKARIEHPATGQVFPADTERVLFRVSAQDDLALQSVDFYLDGKRLASLAYEPFIFSWDASPGKHELKIIAQDQAGNSSETALEFTIDQLP